MCPGVVTSCYVSVTCTSPAEHSVWGWQKEHFLTDTETNILTADWKADMENVADPSSCLIWYQAPLQVTPIFSRSPKKNWLIRLSREPKWFRIQYVFRLVGWGRGGVQWWPGTFSSVYSSFLPGECWDGCQCTLWPWIQVLDGSVETHHGSIQRSSCNNQLWVFSWLKISLRLLESAHTNSQIVPLHNFTCHHSTWTLILLIPFSSLWQTLTGSRNDTTPRHMVKHRLLTGATLAKII